MQNVNNLINQIAASAAQLIYQCLFLDVADPFWITTKLAILSVDYNSLIAAELFQLQNLQHCSANLITF